MEIAAAAADVGGVDGERDDVVDRDDAADVAVAEAVAVAGSTGGHPWWPPKPHPLQLGGGWGWEEKSSSQALGLDWWFSRPVLWVYIQLVFGRLPQTSPDQSVASRADCDGRPVAGRVDCDGRSVARIQCSWPGLTRVHCQTSAYHALSSFVDRWKIHSLQGV